MSKAKDIKSRPKRRSLSRRGALHVPQELKDEFPGYSFRWLTNVGNRVPFAMADGYRDVGEAVKKKYHTLLGDGGLTEVNSVAGDRLTKFGGILEGGQEFNMVLMMIPKEKEAELKAEIDEENDEIDRGLRPNVEFGDEQPYRVK